MVKKISVLNVINEELLRNTTCCKACCRMVADDLVDGVVGRKMMHLADSQIKYFVHEDCFKGLGKGLIAFRKLPHDKSNYDVVAKRCIAHTIEANVSRANAIYFLSFGWKIVARVNATTVKVASPLAHNAKATGKLVKSALECGRTWVNGIEINDFEEFKTLTDLLH